MRPLINIAAILIGLTPAWADDARLLRRFGEPRLCHGYPISAIAFSPDGKLLATAGGPVVRVAHFPHGRLFRQLNLPGASGLAFSSDGRQLTIAAGDRIVSWDLAGDRARTWPRPTRDSGCVGIAYSPDGKSLIVSGRGVTLWSVAESRELRHWPTSSKSAGQAIAFSPDGKRVAVGDVKPGEGGCLRIWRIDGDDVDRIISGLDGAVTALAFTPDGQRLVSATVHSTVQLWDLHTGREIRQITQALDHAPSATPGLPEQPQALALSNDGQPVFAAGPHDRMIRQWQLADGAPGLELPSPIDDVSSLAMSPDGRWLAGGGRDGAVRLWNMADGREREADSAHRGVVFGLGFAADGQTLFSTCTGNLLASWDFTTGQGLAQVKVDFRATDAVLLGSLDFVAGIGPVTFPMNERDSRLTFGMPLPHGSTYRPHGWGPVILVSQCWRVDNGWRLREPPARDVVLGVAPSDQDRVGWLPGAKRVDVVQHFSGLRLGRSRVPSWLPSGLKCMMLDYEVAQMELESLARKRQSEPRESPGNADEERRQAIQAIMREKLVSWSWSPAMVEPGHASSATAK